MVDRICFTFILYQVTNNRERKKLFKTGFKKLHRGFYKVFDI
jgi:hypothetical protein